MAWPLLGLFRIGEALTWPLRRIARISLWFLSVGKLVLIQCAGLFLGGRTGIMSPESSAASNPFPERPIRPLPKRRLRERLSPEVAESIRYPPASQPTAPLFYYPPYTVKEEDATAEAHNEAARRGEDSGSRRVGLLGDTDDEDEEREKDYDYVWRPPLSRF